METTPLAFDIELSMMDITAKIDNSVQTAGTNDDAKKKKWSRPNHSSLPVKRKKRETPVLRKAPQAPKRFRSSYICFFTAKQSEIKKELGDAATVAKISKRSAYMWKMLSPEDRRFWDNVAAKDKQRYLAEKASYAGPWQVPYKRAKKDPSAPKRPMSAFLFFTRGRRRQIQKENPDMKNTEVSKILGDIWRKSTEEERRPFVEGEKVEREKYKIAMSKWKEKHEKRQKDESELLQPQSQLLHQRNHRSTSQQQSYQPPLHHRHQHQHLQQKTEYAPNATNEMHMQQTVQHSSYSHFQPPITDNSLPRYVANSIAPSFDFLNGRNCDVSRDYEISQYPQPSPQQNMFDNFTNFTDGGYHRDDEGSPRGIQPIIDSGMA